jgi:hypothetical protein
MKKSYLETLTSCHGKTFRRRVGIRRRTVRQLYQRGQRHLDEERQQKPLSLTEKLLLTRVYLRQYSTFEELSAMFGVSESYANKVYHRHLDILVKVLRLPGHKALLDEGLQAILLDVTAQPIERPMEHQRQGYSGKKKRHPIKAQLIVCLKTLQISYVFSLSYTRLSHSNARAALTCQRVRSSSPIYQNSEWTFV